LRRVDPVQAVAVQLLADRTGDAQHLLAGVLYHLVVGPGRSGHEAEAAVLRRLQAQTLLAAGVDRAQELPGGSGDGEHLAPPVFIQQAAAPHDGLCLPGGNRTRRAVDLRPTLPAAPHRPPPRRRDRAESFHPRLPPSRDVPAPGPAVASDPMDRPGSTDRCEIRVAGVLDALWADWFEGLAITAD